MTAPPQLPDRLLEHPVYLMLQLVRQARRKGQRPRQPGDIRLPQYCVLAVLVDLGPASQREVADRLGFDASDLVGLVDDLEEDGYVRRQRDTADRRRYILHATAEGRQALQQAQQRVSRLRAEFLAPLSAAEQDAFTGMLRRLYAHHAAAAEPAEPAEPARTPVAGA